MVVHVLCNSYDDIIEGIYTTEGRERKELEFLNQAENAREAAISKLLFEMDEYKETRKPFIEEAEALLPQERYYKEIGCHLYKEINKKRKQLLKQAEKLTSEIHVIDSKILRMQRMTKTQLIANFARDFYWEEHYLEGLQ